MGKTKSLYLGVDVGGTKILGVVATASGGVVVREKAAMPRDVPAEEILSAIAEVATALLAKKKLGSRTVRAMGVAVAGVVDPDSGTVVFSPNTCLTGAVLGPFLEKKLGLPVVVGNDVNFGTLGEYWFGSVGNTKSVVGLFPGTGVGGGIIIEGKLIRGRREFGGEIGHMIMDLDGPVCACGERGCLEAIASRTAIERDLRAAMKAGRKTILTELLKKKNAVIKSGVLRRALEAKDPLVVGVMRKASEVLGKACLNIRHIFDPDAILLGGGLIEACAEFILPIMNKVLAADTLAGATPGAPLLVARLGEDAVALGAVAAALESAGLSRKKARGRALPAYPEVGPVEAGEAVVGDVAYQADILVRVDGSVRKRKGKKAAETADDANVIGIEDMTRACRGGPDFVVIGAGMNGRAKLTPEAAAYAALRGIVVNTYKSPKAATVFNETTGRKALLLKVT